MNVVFFPFGDINTPSGRTRAFSFARELREHGIPTRVLGIERIPALSHGMLGYLLKFIHLAVLMPWAHVIYFQKTSHWSTYLSAIVARVLGRGIVYDIDDSIHTQRRARWVDRFVRISDLVITGSEFLKEYASELNKNVEKVPTPIDMRECGKATKRGRNDNTVIGWLGTSPNLKYLEIVKGPLESLGKKYDLTLRVVSDKGARGRIPKIENIDTELINWSLGSFLGNLQSFDIGIMPLEDNEWTRGKCAYKALEYMSQGIPVVASNVGENRIAIENGKTGFLASTDKEWVNSLDTLIKDENKRRKMGEKGHTRIMKNYSLEKIGEKLSKILLKNFG